MEWQERITGETPPSIRMEHELRYAIAAPLIRGASTWLDLGCGAGVAAAAALEGEGPARAVLVDASADALSEAERDIRADETVTVEADLAIEAGLNAVRAALGEERDGVATCFELIEHLESFIGIVELLVELADARGFTVVLSVPNDAFWPIESPWHTTMWGEGSFEELRRLLPGEHVVAQQVPLQGSSIVPDGTPALEPPGFVVREDAVASHFIAAFGPRRREVVARSAVSQADLAGQRRWERQREANLAFYEDRIQAAEREFGEWREYINELEKELGRTPTTPPLDLP
ncbi:MAG TPA: methyltransferase domain-containing protein [Solirubrobacteraceae bacterium]|nr:methyltransferase domain-containing protein [Solirubrobacteraceae bacterium]